MKWFSPEGAVAILNKANLSITQVEQGIFRISLGEKGGVNSVLLTSNGATMMIDAFGAPSLSAEALKLLQHYGIPDPTWLVYTHWHTDHTFGSSALPPGSTVARRETDTMLRQFVSSGMQQLKRNGMLEAAAFPRFPDLCLQGPAILRVGAFVCELIPMVGHTGDSLIIREQRSGILIAGDMVMGKDAELTPPPVIPPDKDSCDPESLKQSLMNLRKLQPSMIIPGHGSPLQKDELLQDNLERLEKKR